MLCFIGESTSDCLTDSPTLIETRETPPATCDIHRRFNNAEPIHHLSAFPSSLVSMARALQLSRVAFALAAICAISDMNLWLAAEGSQGVRVRYNNANQTALEEDRLQAHAHGSGAKFYPIRKTQYLAFKGDERRKLVPFELCSGCTCCAGSGNQSVCTTSACCYSITCGLPDKPYGVCAFTPRSCNCTSCGS